MKDVMDWGICIREHVKKVEVDFEKIKSMQKLGKIRLKVIHQIKLDEETASIIATDYYEIIKELLIALLLKNGFKSNNHECLISYFKKNFKEYEYETKIIHSLKFVRNRVSYDGFFVKKDYIEDNKLEFEHIIGLLFELLEK
tara:strand:+ start:311 stop:736 length:426 start_codon:yes stop_codon:yes gene_type:complete